MNFRSITDLNNTIVRGLPKVSKETTVIVGIPRSGLLAANMLALHLNLPLADLDGLIARRLLGGGARFKRRLGDMNDVFRTPLIIDDSALSGGSIKEARDRLTSCGMEKNCSFAVVYCSSTATQFVDLYFEELPPKRVFEWNFMHHPTLKTTCLDIDGVLCVDPTKEENDDGPNYERFLESAVPMWIPSVPVGWLVTSRLEKYRPQTEQWLKEKGVVYGDLIMMPYASKAERVRAGSHAQHKATAYKVSGATLFIESCRAQAVKIAQLSGAPVLCVETMEMYHPDTINALVNGAHRKFRRISTLRRFGDALRRKLFNFAPPTRVN